MPMPEGQVGVSGASPWMQMKVEQMKMLKESYKLQNDLDSEQLREEELDMKRQNMAAKKMGAAQLGRAEQMRQTMPFLDMK